MKSRTFRSCRHHALAVWPRATIEPPQAGSPPAKQGRCRCPGATSLRTCTLDACQRPSVRSGDAKRRTRVSPFTGALTVSWPGGGVAGPSSHLRLTGSWVLRMGSLTLENSKQWLCRLRRTFHMPGVLDTQTHVPDLRNSHVSVLRVQIPAMDPLNSVMSYQECPVLVTNT